MSRWFITWGLFGALIVGSIWVARESHPTAHVQTAAPDCAASDTAAERCNAVVINCLSYQVQMIAQIEKLSNKCVGSP